ncbi:MAG: extracellular solute-binding protein [Vulcanimicrobiaceae bacterium]
MNRGAALGGIAASLAALSLAGPAEARRQTDADVSKLYAAAKTEGTLSWWESPYPLNVAESIRAAFKAKYPGVDVQLTRATAGPTYQRALQDFQAGSHELDVLAASDEANFVTLKKMNALAEYEPGDLDKVYAPFRHLDPDNMYQAGALGVVVLNYNPKRVSPPPTKWRDLLDPRYRGQVSLGHPAYSGYVATWASVMREKFGPGFFKSLAENQPKIGRSIYDVTTDIVSGERLIGPGADSVALEDKVKGNAIDVSYPQEDSALVVSPVAVMKHAPHPNAARLFVNFYFSREYAAAVGQKYILPLRGDFASANGMRLSKLKYAVVPVEKQIAQIPEIIAMWRSTFGV